MALLGNQKQPNADFGPATGGGGRSQHRYNPTSLLGRGNSDFGRGYGDRYHWSGQGQLVNGPQQEQQPKDPRIEHERATLTNQGGVSVGGGFGANGLDYDEMGPHTREVGEDELVENRLQGLLESDSPYMQQAMRQGERSAARRGALSSSIFAGASQAAAIERALPIAAQDAQTFSRVASENSQHINNNTLAEMQSKTGIAQASISASASVASSQIAANANREIAQLRTDAEANAREFAAAQEEFMFGLQQAGRLELGEQEFGFREQLQTNEFGQQLTMQERANQYALDQMNFQGGIQDYLQGQRLKMGFVGQMMNGMYQNVNTLNQMGMDEAGFQEAMNNIVGIQNQYMGLANHLFGGGFPTIGGGG